jgi:hypothetical protein
VQVGDDRAVEVDVLAELDLLADGDGQALDDLADGLVADLDRLERLDVGRLGLGRGVGDLWAAATKSSPLATKSVSQRSSTRTPAEWATRPAVAVRSAPRLAALAAPVVRRMSVAASKSPSASTSAFLASIMPAPVMSRSLLTSDAVKVGIAFLPL